MVPFITAAEWLDVNYGAVLRRLLADGLGGTAIHLIDPKAQPFVDAHPFTASRRHPYYLFWQHRLADLAAFVKKVK
jgi:hypothetical protein